MLLADLHFLFPELFLACGAMLALVGGLFCPSPRGIVFVCALILVGTMYGLMIQGDMAGGEALYSGHFSVSMLSQAMKFLLCGVTIMVMAMSVRALPAHALGRFEYPVLMLFATLGLFVMMSAGSWLTFYMGLELQSLSIYVMAAFARDNRNASEGAAKYFILGALASGFILFGVSLIYGATGSIMLHAVPVYPMAMGVGMAFVLAGLAFKLSLVPFHMWTPDVYEGVPTPVAAYLALVPKIGALIALVNILHASFAAQAEQAGMILMAAALLSMALGSFAGLRQTSLKRLLAYSTIANVGTLVLALSVITPFGTMTAINYLLIYILMSGLIFAVILGLYKGVEPVSKLDDLKGLAKTHPFSAWALAIALFAIAGIPPFAGFFAKYEVFHAVVMGGHVVVAAIGILFSVVAAAYYLRLIKIMFFDPAPEDEEPVIADNCLARRAIVCLLLFKIIVLVLLPDVALQFVGMIIPFHG